MAFTGGGVSLESPVLLVRVGISAVFWLRQHDSTSAQAQNSVPTIWKTTVNGASFCSPASNSIPGLRGQVGGRTDPQALRRAYLKLAVQHHPDKSAHAAATAIFQARGAGQSTLPCSLRKSVVGAERVVS